MTAFSAGKPMEAVQLPQLRAAGTTPAGHPIVLAVIHGDNDPLVPLVDAELLTEKLQADLTVVPNGGHLNGSAGFLELPMGLAALEKMF